MSFEIQADEVFLNLGKLLLYDDSMPMEVAQELIGSSAYWYGHPHGPAHAPKHAERVTDGEHGWEIEFGANIFLVEVAIRRCVKHIAEAAERAAETETPVNESQLRDRLALAVQGSVANYNGDEYVGYYDASDGFMHFGTQAIHVASFVSKICDMVEIYRIAE